jgi:uncharacterized protein
MQTKQKNNKVENNNLLKYILIILVVVIAAYFIYDYFSKKKETGLTVKSTEEQLNNIKEPQFVKQGELEFLKKDKKLISKIDIEIADNEAKSVQGLMYRKSMEENRGMLFVFSKAEEHSFWMKNTLISLDIIFVDSDKKIIKIHKHTTPLSTKGLPSGGLTLYVVEVNAGYTDKFGISEGDMINFTRQ